MKISKYWNNNDIFECLCMNVWINIYQIFSDSIISVIHLNNIKNYN